MQPSLSWTKHLTFRTEQWAPRHIGTTGFADEWQITVAENKAALQAKADEIEELLAKHNVSGEVCIPANYPRLVADVAARHAMLCDMVDDDVRKMPETLFQQTLRSRGNARGDPPCAWHV